jgi:hypothetical protein
MLACPKARLRSAFPVEKHFKLNLRSTTAGWGLPQPDAAARRLA